MVPVSPCWAATPGVDRVSHHHLSSAELRIAQDRELAEQMALEFRRLFPGCASEEAAAIARHTATRSSGRVGRTAAGRNLEPQALIAAIKAAVRHRHTNYDELLAAGWDRTQARQQVAAQVEEILSKWKQ